ncbi:MAG: hypothetical protein INF43_02655 [Alphaproteobacteria bacterium]|nr:hypothetical protein [Alphaproteobacteria bacterium]
MAIAKKPTKATAKKPTSKAASSFKPLPEATPRYVAPPPAPKPAPVVAEAGPSDWDLSLRFWWAQFWRTMVVVIPATIILQLFLAFFFSLVGGGVGALQQAIIMGLTLTLSVALQVAVVRHMLRKKSFKGFTFTLKGRE